MYNHTNIITPIEMQSKDTPFGRFYTTPNGDKYPSITTILSSGPKNWLENWKTSIGSQRAEQETKKATERGTAVHLMIERLLKNEQNVTEGQKQEHISQFNTLKTHLKYINNIVAQENALYSDVLKVAGRVDCIAEYKNQLCIIDFKTSGNNKTESMIQNYYLQVTAYALMFEEMYGIQINNAIILMSVENGIVPLVFKTTLEQYYVPLIETINSYYNKQK